MALLTLQRAVIEDGLENNSMSAVSRNLVFMEGGTLTLQVRFPAMDLTERTLWDTVLHVFGLSK